jgi:hypothetical protein
MGCDGCSRGRRESEGEATPVFHKFGSNLEDLTDGSGNRGSCFLGVLSLRMCTLFGYVSSSEDCRS